MTMKTIYLTILIMLFSCAKNDNVSDDVLTLKKTIYTGTQLKTNGYYYMLENNNINSIFFLYKNGIINSFGASGSNFLEAESNFTNSHVLDIVYNNKYNWGLFIIENNNLKIEKWQTGNGSPFPAYFNTGKILNDTTFQLTELYRLRNGQKTEFVETNYTYHFRKYSPKPDSINNFIP